MDSHFALALSLAAVCGTAWAQGQNPPRPVVRYASRTDTTVALRRMPPIPPMPKVLGQIFERPRKMLPNREGSLAPAGQDPALQSALPGPSAPTTGPNFEGVSNVNSVLPPDTDGDIGPNHYVQMVNLSFAIWNRNGTLLYGPVNNSTLWQGFGGPCAANNDGDPIVLYDHLADRWMMSQFALPNYPLGPFYQCIAVSQTPDPLGAWRRYEFLMSQTKLNDYPKFGVWPDGYYMSINQFNCNVSGCSWGGQGTVVFERDKMLLGQPARMVYFDLHSTDPNLGGMLPSDLDGPAPPAGAPNYFVEVDDDAWGYSPDQLQIWDFRVNWSSPSASTFTRQATLGTAAFDTNLCGYSRNCVPQPVTARKLDAISDRLMYRLQYRNFGSHQALVVNHTVDANGLDRAGIRWYELRKTSGGWSIRQQSTFSPDSDHRWMGSLAMNGAGDMALGYSISSGTLYPSIRATGRLATDALSQMTQGEIVLRLGSGYQTHSASRWGDYSMMGVDPVDDCTFWYTQEYYAVAGSAPWQTRIAAFKLRDCGPANNPPVASFTYICTGLTCTFDGSGSTDSDGSIVSYAWNFGDGGTATVVAPSHTYAASGTYPVTLTVTDNGGATGSQTQNVTVSSGQSTVHVGDLDGAKTSQAKTWTARVTITVHNASHATLAGATVTGNWSAGATGTSSCTTDTTGRCSVSKNKISNTVGSVMFSVTNVTASGQTYNSAANHDGDTPADSTGTSITVTKP